MGNTSAIGLDININNSLSVFLSKKAQMTKKENLFVYVFCCVCEEVNSLDYFFSFVPPCFDFLKKRIDQIMISFFGFYPK